MGGAFLSLQMSRWIAKRAVGIHLIDGRSGHAELDRVYETVANLTRQAGLPMPEVGVYDSPDVNAFATGPSKKRSLVAVSTGLLQAMPPQEVEALLAHEVGHIANGDMVTMALLQGVINAFVLFFARIAAFAVRMAVPARVAWIAGFATRIVLEISLGILGSLVTAFSRQREFRADAASAALAAMKISGRKAWLRAFSTHPPLDERIAALEAGR